MTRDAGRRGLAPTWILMATALVITLALPDWTGEGCRRPIWLLCIPALLGFAGALLAAPSGRLRWAVGSVIWGLLLVPLLMMTLVLVSGP